MTTHPSFVDLTRTECDAILARNQVGRLGFRRGEHVDIQPVSYAVSGQWVFIRSAYGAKVEAITRNPFVVFEVDEEDGPYSWRSVVVRGTIYMLPADGSPAERRELQHALEALRQVEPRALTRDDPVPGRSMLYGLHIQACTGRAALVPA